MDGSVGAQGWKETLGKGAGDLTKEELEKARRARASGGRQGVVESGEADGSDVR